MRLFIFLLIFSILLSFFAASAFDDLPPLPSIPDDEIWNEPSVPSTPVQSTPDKASPSPVASDKLGFIDGFVPEILIVLSIFNFLIFCIIVYILFSLSSLRKKLGFDPGQLSQVKGYVRFNLGKGYTSESVRAELQKMGYPDEIIDSAFEQVYKSVEK